MSPAVTLNVLKYIYGIAFIIDFVQVVHGCVHRVQPALAAFFWRLNTNDAKTLNATDVNLAS